ncbi:MAG: hypothetical protein MPK11_04265 [Gammaproteobacteria bacterium]|nr:hypothetical protein [Gammaproteobacteria bacterium]CAJ2375905.1 MAG: hypothetical protein IBGAMO2_150017 [Arenicellales bacterium IbO2]MDA7961800.1 hypothetical protein [Gammaproteobacteria bacterium]MDA7969978.1 hypothetical protein [Gammaproteobacteria bacterium]MDA7972815.1 hypothetical protein [Gammaproteobacteria bacterium]
MNALSIWKELARECMPTVLYYKSKAPELSKYDILQQGSADFDCKCRPDDPCEQPRYRSDYYVSREGYMEMHIRQNLAMLNYCFGGSIPQSLLWVDFGCGPMTSGLALAECLAVQNPNYKHTTAYFGIDASRNMVEKAQYINAKRQMFAPKCFKVAHSQCFEESAIPPAWTRVKTIVLCCSFVLAPGTFKANSVAHTAAQALANQWKSFVAKHHCTETFVFYLNPVSYSLHNNWYAFRNAMRAQDHSTGFRYTGGELVPLPVPKLRNPVTLAKIHGVRQ